MSVKKVRATTIIGLLGLALASATDGRAASEPPSPAGPFASLAGWWGGDGRLSFKDGKVEQVKCRATYFVEAEGKSLKQTVRCASGSGKIEVSSNVAEVGGKLSGTWSEQVYGLSGSLDGEVTPRGFRVSVKNEANGAAANMEIVVRDVRQIVELQFYSETLIGLTLVLQKGEAQ